MSERRRPRVRPTDLRHIASDIEEIAGAGSWTLTFATGDSVWSPGLYALFELDPATTRPSLDAFNERIHPDDRERSLAEFADAVRDRTPGDQVHRIVTGSGRTKTVLSRSHAYYADGDGGTPLYAVGVLADITRQQLVRKKLDDATSQLMAVWEHVPEGFILTDADGTIVDCNPHAEGALGYAHDQLVGRNELSLYRESARPEAAEALQRGRRAPLAFESELVTADDRSVAVEVSTSGPFHLGERTLALASFRDIGARKRAEATAGLAMQHERERAAEVEQALEGALRALSEALERRDPATAGHEQLVAHLAGLLARDLGLDAERQRTLRLAALVHDVGTVAVPTEMLLKGAPLTPLEYQFVQEHSRAGYEIVSSIPFLDAVAELVFSHHELLDGSGYPRHLTGEALSLEARILTVADVYSAMTAARPYRGAHTPQAALDQLRAMAPAQLDARVVETCARLIEGGASEG